MDLISEIDFNAILTVIWSYGLRIVGSLIILIVGKWLSKKISYFVNTILIQSKIDETLRKFVYNAIETAVIVFAIIAALSNLGVNTTSFVAILGAVSLAIGMAFKDTFSNIGAGILIVFFRPFRILDYIEVANCAGSVKEISLFTTSIKTSDNKLVIIPNSRILSSTIINYSRESERRVEIKFGISYESDIKKAKNLVIQLAKQDNRILTNPEPFVGIIDLADSSVNFVARFWTKNENYWNVYFDMIENIKISFDEHDIIIPFPQMDLRIKNEK